MLSLRTVATTDGATSLHSPVFVVGVIPIVVVVGDEHDVATRDRAVAATQYRMKNRGRTGSHYTRCRDLGSVT